LQGEDDLATLPGMTQMIDTLIFGVFGTCVDWRGQAGRAIAQALPQVDPWAFADAWRGEYQFRWV
jgi:2-haloacid dehalogenase